MFTEDEIIEGCLRNDRKMQKALYDKYASRMFAVCLRYAKNRDDAADILQDGFLKVFIKIDQFSREHSFEGWIRRVMTNTAITHYYQNKKYNEQKNIEEINETDVKDFEFSEAEFSNEELMNVIQTLPDTYRIVFNMFAIEGYKHKEISEMLDIEVSTVKTQYHRAKKMIQVKLEELAKEKNSNVE
ncbi:MAG: RNA polymerase sigma factor [Bacteroidales bacterium]|nr:RNA polymerase sigma factor [Bacteroidales bacterium]